MFSVPDSSLTSKTALPRFEPPNSQIHRHTLPPLDHTQERPYESLTVVKVKVWSLLFHPFSVDAASVAGPPRDPTSGSPRWWQVDILRPDLGPISWRRTGAWCMEEYGSRLTNVAVEPWSPAGVPRHLRGPMTHFSSSKCRVTTKH